MMKVQGEALLSFFEVFYFWERVFLWASPLAFLLVSVVVYRLGSHLVYLLV
jgi:hypothetical protein